MRRRYAAAMATPQPVRIEIEDGTSVSITWDDDTTTTLQAAQLRRACPCAGCREPDGRQRTDLVLGGPVPVNISDARLVGGYALTFVFSPDGHATGIYPFSGLYEMGRSAGPG